MYKKIVKKILLFFSLSFFILFILFPFFDKPALAVTSNNDRVIVKFYPYVSEEMKDKFIKSYSIGKPEKMKLMDTFVLKVPKGGATGFIQKFIKNSLIDYIEPDFVAQAVETPNDTYYSNQWGLPKVKADLAWSVSHGLSSVKVAIVDTGIDSSHPDISGKVQAAANCTTSSGCTALSSSVDDNGHGTHVAGIAAARTNNNLGVSGIGYDTSLISVKVLDSSGSGYYSWISNGIIWAADNGARVINMSLGGKSSSVTLQNSVDYAWNKGLVIAAAAGNSNSSKKFYPAYYSNVIAVAATDSTDKKASFSNYGSWVDVAAPGVSIYSTYKGGYDYLSGTSMASPFVAGLAGLVFGYHPDWTNSQVRDKIQNSADKIPGTGSYWAFGRINACLSLDCSGTVTPTTTLTPTPTVTSPTQTSTPTVTPTPNTSPSPIPTPWWCERFPQLCR